MNLSIGIVGLPNVGKSTLFNALLKKQQALAANYPFATIEPNIGVVAVLDERLQKLAEITKVEEKMVSLPPIKPATVEFVDIAGLVKGASEGAGLGNKFLSHIREVFVIAHVVRVFEDENVVKEGAVDPKSDYETIRTELQIADLQTLQNLNEKALRTDPIKRQTVEKLKEALDNGKNAFEITLTEEESLSIRQLSLLTSKKEIIVLNVAEDKYNPEGIADITQKYSDLLNINNEKIVVICAKIESELALLSEEEQKEYLKEMGLQQSGLERLIQKAYQELGLISFLTAGVKEVRAWTIKKGFNALLASGEIHTDFMKKFIKAEVVSYKDFVENNGWRGSKEKGKTKLEGKEYIMQDGDIVEFKIGT
ncbi:MAG: redox-regulated ATPase YchF [Candidatus Levybacteria bacterium]|nr:redox-regulated ATPase YchF [Candidatus Levybacteria bacterium]